MQEQLQGLYVDALLDLKEITFAYIPQPEAKYFSQEALFGEMVYQTFPDARDDIKQSGNAIALDMGTAAVFHLMRAAERGIRVLAWDREQGGDYMMMFALCWNIGRFNWRRES